MSFVIFGREKEMFGLDHSLHTSLFQVKVDSIGRDGLIDDGSECSSHLNSIVSFSRGD